MNTIYNFCRYAASILLVLGLTTSCNKEDDPLPAKDENAIASVLRDNYNFSILYKYLGTIQWLDTLSNAGPYTIFAPENNGFFQYTFPPQKLREILPYSVLPGRVAVGKLPLNTLQVYKTMNGGNIYVNSYKDGNDTITTVNGYKLTSKDNAASNGLIQVVPRYMNAELYATVKLQLQSDTALTMFSAIVQQAGLNELLDGNDTYTLVAPSNIALQQSANLGWGISTVDSILAAKPQQLVKIVKSHLLKGRYFEADLYWFAKNNPDGITMEDGSKVKIGGNPATFKAITFLGTGNNGQAAGIYTPGGYTANSNNANLPCGNGVIHIINKVLIP